MTTAGQACGLAVHHEIIDRATALLDKQGYPRLATLLGTQHGVIEAGAVFPDWGYGMPFDQEYWRHLAEDAHGAAYRDAYLNYARGPFRAPGVENDKIVTFLFGLIGHLEADGPWHLNPGGFEVTADQQDDGDGTAVEIAGDVFANVEYGESSDGDSWVFPIDAIRASYLTLGHDVPQYQLEQGFSILATAHGALKGTSYAQYYSLSK